MRVRCDVGIARRERLGLLYRRRAHRRYLANMRCRPASGVSVRDQERAASCAASYAGRVTSETSNKSAAVTVRSRPSAVRVTRSPPGLTRKPGDHPLGNGRASWWEAECKYE